MQESGKNGIVRNRLHVVLQSLQGLIVQIINPVCVIDIPIINHVHELILCISAVIHKPDTVSLGIHVFHQRIPVSFGHNIILISVPIKVFRLQQNAHKVILLSGLFQRCCRFGVLRRHSVEQFRNFFRIKPLPFSNRIVHFCFNLFIFSEPFGLFGFGGCIGNVGFDFPQSAGILRNHAVNLCVGFGGFVTKGFAVHGFCAVTHRNRRRSVFILNGNFRVLQLFRFLSHLTNCGKGFVHGILIHRDLNILHRIQNAFGFSRNCADCRRNQSNGRCNRQRLTNGGCCDKRADLGKYAADFRCFSGQLSNLADHFNRRSHNCQRGAKQSDCPKRFNQGGLIRFGQGIESLQNVVYHIKGGLQGINQILTEIGHCVVQLIAQHFVLAFLRGISFGNLFGHRVCCGVCRILPIGFFKRGLKQCAVSGHCRNQIGKPNFGNVHFGKLRKHRISRFGIKVPKPLKEQQHGLCRARIPRFQEPGLIQAHHGRKLIQRQPA